MVMPGRPALRPTEASLSSTRHAGRGVLQKMQRAVKKFGFESGRLRARTRRFDHRRPLPGTGPHVVHNEQIVHEYPNGRCAESAAEGQAKIYAVEGGTAAMCYIFKSLKSNRILNPATRLRSACRSLPALEMAHPETTISTSSRCTRSRKTGSSIRRGDQEAARPEDQGVLRRQSGQPVRRSTRTTRSRNRKGTEEAA
jgi:hypothetical protein